MSADILAFNRKKVAAFMEESEAERFIIISADDPIGLMAIGDMSKAELLGTMLIALLMAADQV